MITGVWFLGAVIAALPVGSSPDTVLLPNCLVSLIEEAQVPAQEAGVLVRLAVKEGNEVKATQILAQIDDLKTQMEVRVAQAKLTVAAEKAKDDINIRYADAAAKVAGAEYQVSKEANDRVPGTVPQTVLNQLLLKHRETMLAIEKARLEQKIAAEEAKVAQVEADAAAENLNRRKIRAPLDGVVVQLQRHAGEWVQPGDSLLHIVRIDRLWVEGFVSATDFNPTQIQDRSATVKVKLAHGEQITVPGQIVFVKPLVEAGGRFLVRAEISRPDDRTPWPLRPGMAASMTIQLK